MKIQWRFLLPLGHLAIDCLLLLTWVLQSDARFRPHAERHPVRFERVLFQEGEGIEFNPRYDVVAAPTFAALALGCAPAILISQWLRPEAHIQTRAKRWDPIWFGIHEAVAFAIWFSLGYLCDTGKVRAIKALAGFMLARIAFTLFPEVGSRLEAFFWLGFLVWAMVMSGGWIVRRVRAGTMIG
jgi:hypothetical protein